MQNIISRLDHLVITVADSSRTIAFYKDILGMRVERFGPQKQRIALRFGEQKINVHVQGEELQPNAAQATVGSADLCFIVTTKVETLLPILQGKGVDVFLGPVDRTGALGPIRSIYFRDPDGNLIELSTYL